MFFQKCCSINNSVGGAKGVFARFCPIWANTDNDATWCVVCSDEYKWGRLPLVYLIVSWKSDHLSLRQVE